MFSIMRETMISVFYETDTNHHHATKSGVKRVQMYYSGNIESRLDVGIFESPRHAHEGVLPQGGFTA